MTGDFADEPVPVALIGAGWVAEHVYVPALKCSPLRPIAVYDPDAARASRVATMLGLRDPSATFDACLDSAVRAVILCTPAHLHATHLDRCLRAGKFVLCEKPVLHGTRELATLASLNGASDHVMGSAAIRMREDVGLLLSWVRSGYIGRVRRVRLGWWRERGVPGPGTWRTDAALSPDGVFADLGPHLLDLAAAVLLDIPESAARVVSASLDCRHGSAARSADWFGQAESPSYTVPDTARAIFETPGGVVIEVDTCWTGDTPGDLCRVQFEGSRGRVSLRGLFGLSTARRLPEQVCWLERDGNVVECRRFPTDASVQRCAFAASVARFAAFCRGEDAPVANFAQIAQVAVWMQAVRDAALDPVRACGIA